MVKELVNIIEKNKVIAGESHPADGIIALMAERNPNYIEILYLIISSYPNIRSDLFKLLCRLDSKHVNNLTFHRICRRFLNDENVEVVDAAIGMFELFSDKSILRSWLLSKPNQPKWLLDYAEKIINQDSSL